jgi:hypothetical protein
MLHKVKQNNLIMGISILLVISIGLSIIGVTPVKAQIGEFIGIYDYTLNLEGMELSGEMEMYQYQLNETIETYYGTYNPTTVIHRPDFRLETSSSNYIDILDQNSYSNVEGDLVLSETTYSIHLAGYQQVTYTATYEYGDYDTVTNNATLLEETYTERYYEDGVFVESVIYHDYTYLVMDDSEAMTDSVTVDAGVFDCFILDLYSFEGLDTDIDDLDDWDFYQGGSLVWVDLEDGHLVQQWQFDEYNDIVAEISLKSLEDPRPSGGTIDSPLILVGGGAGAAILIAAGVARSRRGGSSDYHDVTPVEWG